MMEAFLSKQDIDKLVSKWWTAIDKGCFSCQAGCGHGQHGKWTVPATVVCTGCGYGYCAECAKHGCYLCMEEAE
jgi:hypothetical protein